MHLTGYVDGLRVVPHVGTWIEIDQDVFGLIDEIVVPHVGTWIEILSLSALTAPLCRASRRHVD